MTLVHVDPISGTSGDMLLGALVDCGVSPDDLRAILGGLDIDGWELETESVTRGGMGAMSVRVQVESSPVVRTWGNLRTMLAGADLPETVRARALGTFQRLAEAEAQVHRTDPERVHFHEVGGVDAIVDIVGVCAGLHLLGVRRVTCGPLPQGVGMTRGQHGMIPIPAPAVLELLRGVAAPTYSTGIAAELCTPTGVALLAEWVDGWGELPAMLVQHVGYGAGTRELEQPNVLRLVVGRPASDGASQMALLLETTVDDLSGELLPPVIDALLVAGAYDAWARPVVMKKGRPGLEIACIGPPATGPALRDVLFRETTTLGVRGRLCDRWALEREFVSVEVAGEPVRLKVGRLEGEVVNVAPEYEDCAQVAAQTGLPLKEVFARARAAWSEPHRRVPTPPESA